MVLNYKPSEKFLNDNLFSIYRFALSLLFMIALPHCVVLIEKQWVDVVMRYGIPEWIIKKDEQFPVLNSVISRHLV